MPTLPSLPIRHALVAALCLSGCALAGASKNDTTSQLSGGGSGGGGSGGTTATSTTGGTGGGTTQGTSTQAPGADPNAPMLTTTLTGRFTAGTAGTPNTQVFGWSASTMSAHFTGTGIGVTLEELESPSNPNGNFYDVSVDGNVPATFATSSGSAHYSLVSGLPSGSHSVQLRKRTEGHIGSTRFGGFDVTGGQLTAYRGALARRMLIIGDSISCGYGLEGTSQTCTFSPATENASKTYGVRAAAALNADVHVVAWSGKGVYRNNDNTTGATLPLLFPQTLATDTTPAWDPNAYVPQVIAINLLTNDFYTGVPPQASFVAAYVAFLKTLRGYYPNAQIFCIVGPMLSDTYPEGEMALTTARGYVNQVISQMGDAKITLLEFPVLQTAQMGCDSHPNDGAHAAMATQLQAAITAAQPW